MEIKGERRSGRKMDRQRQRVIEGERVTDEKNH